MVLTEVWREAGSEALEDELLNVLPDYRVQCNWSVFIETAAHF